MSAICLSAAGLLVMLNTQQTGMLVTRLRIGAKMGDYYTPVDASSTCFFYIVRLLFFVCLLLCIAQSNLLI